MMSKRKLFVVAIDLISVLTIAFLCIDLVVLRWIPVEKSIGGEIAVTSILVTTVVFFVVLRLVQVLIWRKEEALPWWSIVGLNSLALGLILVLDKFWFYKLTGYLESVVVFHIMFFIISIFVALIGTSVIFRWLSGIVLAAYIALIFILPRSTSRQIGTLSSDWIVLQEIQSGIRNGDTCEAVLENKVLFPIGEEKWDCNSMMIPVKLTYFPEAILHFCEGKLCARSINWRPFD